MGGLTRGKTLQRRRTEATKWRKFGSDEDGGERRGDWMISQREQLTFLVIKIYVKVVASRNGIFKKLTGSAGGVTFK